MNLRRTLQKVRTRVRAWIDELAEYPIVKITVREEPRQGGVMTLQEVDSLKFGDRLCWGGAPFRYLEPATLKSKDSWSQGHAIWNEERQKVYWIGGATWELIERAIESKDGA